MNDVICEVCEKSIGSDSKAIDLDDVLTQEEGKAHTECWSQTLLENNVRDHRIKIKKIEHGKGPTQYPITDTVIAKVTINIPEVGGRQTHDFPFIRNEVVAGSDNDNLEPFYDVLLYYGIEIDLDSHPVWDKNATTFDEAGFQHGVLHDTLPERLSCPSKEHQSEGDN